jgi:hypothetical protein
MRRGAVALLLMASACGGPQPELSFGGKAVPVNVSFGKPAADDPRAETPFVLAPVLGGVGVVPVAEPKPRRVPRVDDLPPLAPSTGCGPEDARITPAAEATPELSEGEVPGGDYPYRLEAKVDGKEYSGDFVRTVEDFGTRLDGTRAFTVRTTALGVEQEWVYETRPTLDRVPGMVGLRSVSTSGQGVDGRPSFEGAKAITLLPLDAAAAATFEDATTDPRTATTFKVSGRVVGKDQVWACGANIDAWQVAIIQDVVTPLQRISAEITYWIATQYGGMVVQESVAWRGMAGITEVEGYYTATINKVPGS